MTPGTGPRNALTLREALGTDFVETEHEEELYTDPEEARRAETVS